MSWLRQLHRLTLLFIRQTASGDRILKCLRIFSTSSTCPTLSRFPYSSHSSPHSFLRPFAVALCHHFAPKFLRERAPLLYQFSPATPSKCPPSSSPIVTVYRRVLSNTRFVGPLRSCHILPLLPSNSCHTGPEHPGPGPYHSVHEFSRLCRPPTSSTGT